MERVVLGLSGGVDSAASAILLQRRGYEVHALFMDNGFGTPDRARACAERLGLPFAVADMREPFEQGVIKPFFADYLAGRTPNPCAVCNPRVKFRALFDYADAHGCAFVATGHYARAEAGFLYRGAGPHDQSYLLYRLPRAWVERCLFPLGTFVSKEEVRAVAGEVFPETSRAAASMDICFVPDGMHWKYIESRGVRPPDGEFVDDTGRVLGVHHGIHRYTVGMRRRLGVATGERMYVRTIDPQTNRITLSPAHEPRASLVEIGEMNWFELPAPGRIYGARVRHSRKMGEAKWVSGATDSCVLRVSPDCGVPAPGQSAVLYDGERVLGGGKNKFLNNELDVLISSEPFDDQTVERYFLFRERFYLVMPSGQKQNLTMPLLKKVAQELPYIRYNNESIDRRQTEMIYRLLHIRQKKQIKVESSFAMTGLIALGKGWAVMPPLSLWQGRDFIDSLSVHPMPDVTINREFWIVSHSKAWSEACEKIRHTIVRCFDEGFAQRLNALNNRLTVKW